MTINLLSLMLGSSLRSISASPTRDSYRALARDCLHRVLNSEHSDPLALLGHILTSTVLASFHNNNDSFNATLESLLNFCSFPNFHELIILARLIESVDASSLTSSSSFLFSSTNLLNNENDNNNILNNENDNNNILRNENEINDNDNNDDSKRKFDLDALRDFLVARFKELYKKRTSVDNGNEEDISLFKSRCRYDLFAEYLVQFVALDDELEPLLLDVLSLPPVLCLESQDLNRPSLISCDDDEPLLHTGEVVCEMGPVSCCLSVENFKKSMFLSSSTGSIKTLSEDDVARVLNYIIL